jgi:macrolide transport system ATP-binding/permease protein
MESIVQDIRVALRQLRKSPGFALAAILTLGLGIGANTTIFQWLNWLVGQPLPGVDSSRLYYVRWRTPDGARNSTSWPTSLDIRQRSKSLEQFAVGRGTTFSLGDSTGRPERIFGMLVSANYFGTLGVRAAQGRTFQPEEDSRPGAHPVAVISHALWLSKFGQAPDVVGKTIKLNTHTFTVVGVTPQGFQGSTVGLRHDIWVPAMMRGEIMGGADTLSNRGDRWLEAYALPKPGVSFAQAEQELNLISAQLTRELFKSDRYARVDAVPIWKHAAGQVLGPVLIVMSAVVGVVLLIACANVGNLLLTRAVNRRREMALRIALGVRRSRLIRQLLVENGVLALLSALLALATIPFTAGLLAVFTPQTDIAISLNVPVDWRAFAFTLAISAVATLLFGLAPALRSSREDVISALKEESGSVTVKSRLRNVLVVAQVALSIVLLVGAGLLLRSLQFASSMNPGFEPRNVLVAGVDLLPNGYDARNRGPQFVQQAIARLSALPGVASVSSVRRVPLGLGGTSSTSISVNGYTPAQDENPMSMLNNVGPDYFRTMGTALIAGRDLRPDDDASKPLVAVINETFAKRYFVNRDPLGQTFRAGRDYTIIGVARDSKFQSLDEAAVPFFWVSTLQVNASETNFLIRTSGSDPLSLASAVEKEIHTLDPAIPVFGIRALEDSISVAYLPQRMGGWLLGFFGGLALMLAAIGLYGVLAYTVALRTREVGIRVALGATSQDVTRMVLRDGMRLTAIGALIGIAISLGVSRFLVKLLFGVSPTDAATLGGVSVLLLIVALAASYFPARRAARIDPLAAIRAE